MNVGRFTRRLGYFVLAVLAVMGGVWPAGARAQEDQAHAAMSHRHPSTSDHRAGAFVKLVRDVTRRFQDVSVALDAGYEPRFGCVSGSHEGAMGVHLVNFGLLDDILNPAEPELLVYEPLPGGRLRLVAADYLIFSAAWHAKNKEKAPELMGQLFHLFDSPNRFALDPFYTLHVWAWKDNPQGTFANWNPNVSCDAFNPEQP